MGSEFIQCILGMHKAGQADFEPVDFPVHFLVIKAEKTAITAFCIKSYIGRHALLRFYRPHPNGKLSKEEWMKGKRNIYWKKDQGRYIRR